MQAVSSKGPFAIAYHVVYLVPPYLYSPDLPCPLQPLCSSNTTPTPPVCYTHCTPSTLIIRITLLKVKKKRLMLLL